MMELDDRQKKARAAFESLRDRICAEFEAIEDEAGGDARFAFTPWDRLDDNGQPGGGGVRGSFRGKIFEKAGVNVSTVWGSFNEEFAKTIKGAETDPRFFATGISLVAHMANPHVPAVHMNLRFLNTTKCWFGGGADLNPPIPYKEDTDAFHTALFNACEAHEPGDYERFTKWADDYFWIPHRNLHRGVGGIFYDHLEIHDEEGFTKHLAFSQAVGEAFLKAFPAIVRKRMDEAFTAADRATQLEWRGRYAEFNLIYDRGTLFGLKTGGNVDAILMSLPPLATWR
ncbi:MAG: oxygen-dependent coproporphyrinogen oxidase [Sphingomonadaceae bacterium]|nr:oxygen-dependent coproporphyrinogen oxidase [Sphingomonadaceae bacterium]